MEISCEKRICFEPLTLFFCYLFATYRHIYSVITNKFTFNDLQVYKNGVSLIYMYLEQYVGHTLLSLLELHRQI